MFFLPILMLSQSFFLNIGQGPFPKIARKSPAYIAIEMDPDQMALEGAV